MNTDLTLRIIESHLPVNNTVSGWKGLSEDGFESSIVEYGCVFRETDAHVECIFRARPGKDGPPGVKEAPFPAVYTGYTVFFPGSTERRIREFTTPEFFDSAGISPEKFESLPLASKLKEFGQVVPLWKLAWSSYPHRITAVPRLLYTVEVAATDSGTLMSSYQTASIEDAVGFMQQTRESLAVRRTGRRTVRLLRNEDTETEFTV